MIAWIVMSMSAYAQDCEGLEGEDKAKCEKKLAKKVARMERAVDRAAGIEIPLKEIQPTGIESVDAVFEPVKKVIDDLKGSRDELRKANETIDKIIGVKEGEDPKEALRRFAESNGIKVVVQKASAEQTEEGAEETKKKGLPIPKLGGGIPMPRVSTTKSDGSAQEVVRSLTKAVDGAAAVVKTCTQIPGALKKTIPKATLMPLQIGKIAKKNGVGPEGVKELGDKIKHNAQATTMIPKLAGQTLGEAKDLLALVGSLAKKKDGTDSEE